MNQSEVADGGALQLGVFFSLRGFDELFGIASEEERLQDAPAHGRGRFRLIELAQFLDAVNEA